MTDYEIKIRNLVDRITRRTQQGEMRWHRLHTSDNDSFESIVNGTQIWVICSGSENNRGETSYLLKIAVYDLNTRQHLGEKHFTLGYNRIPREANRDDQILIRLFKLWELIRAPFLIETKREEEERRAEYLKGQTNKNRKFDDFIGDL